MTGQTQRYYYSTWIAIVLFFVVFFFGFIYYEMLHQWLHDETFLAGIKHIQVDWEGVKYAFSLIFILVFMPCNIWFLFGRVVVSAILRQPAIEITESCIKERLYGFEYELAEIENAIVFDGSLRLKMADGKKCYKKANSVFGKLLMHTMVPFWGGFMINLRTVKGDNNAILADIEKAIQLHNNK